MREENPQKTSGLPAAAGNEQEQRAPVTKLVIDRSRWLRGEGHDASALVRGDDGKMCCLGFLGRAVGIPERLMLNVGDPFETPLTDNETWPEWLLVMPTVNSLIIANDLGSDEAAREAEIARIFAEHGVEVTFVDAASPAISSPPKAKITSEDP